jgi:aspartate oxidase
MNGGLAVDTWGRTSLSGCYAIGEAAGTHGVTRPGGAALNAGQVFGARCAEHIAARATSPVSETGNGLIETGVGAILGALAPESPCDAETIREQVQARMSDHAGLVCKAEAVQAALAAAQSLNREIARQGVAYDGATEAQRALQWRHMALASEAVLAALAFYIERGGGSRGARAVCNSQGESVPSARAVSLESFRFRPERSRDRAEQILVRKQRETFVIAARPLRAVNAGDKPFFERNWPDFLTGAIYDEVD